jgi:hypothetical protein
MSMFKIRIQNSLPASKNETAVRECNTSTAYAFTPVHRFEVRRSILPRSLLSPIIARFSFYAVHVEYKSIDRLHAANLKVYGLVVREALKLARVLF